MSGTKESVLKYLEKNRGSFSSGEKIASELKLSRNSVWKAIESLRRDGYRIEAASRRGYSLSAESDVLSVSGITSFLSDNINTDLIKIYDRLESTNKTAKSAAAFDAPHGSVVIAKSQSSGSGRRNRTFFSPEGGIYMSVILKPESLPFTNTALVTAYTAVCICETIEKLVNVTPSIKWVNDIYIGSKKICGILTESASDFETGMIQWIVVGIGINFSVDITEFPRELRSKAGSLFTPGDETISKNHLIAEILSRLFSAKKHAKNPASSILKKYRSHMNMLGEEITVICPDGSKYKAIAHDIDENGKLIVKLPDETKKTLSSEEISIMI